MRTFKPCTLKPQACLFQVDEYSQNESQYLPFIPEGFYFSQVLGPYCLHFLVGIFVLILPLGEFTYSPKTNVVGRASTGRKGERKHRLPFSMTDILLSQVSGQRVAPGYESLFGPGFFFLCCSRHVRPHRSQQQTPSRDESHLPPCHLGPDKLPHKRDVLLLIVTTNCPILPFFPDIEIWRTEGCGVKTVSQFSGFCPRIYFDRFRFERRGGAIH